MRGYGIIRWPSLWKRTLGLPHYSRTQTKKSFPKSFVWTWRSKKNMNTGNPEGPRMVARLSEGQRMILLLLLELYRCLLDTNYLKMSTVRGQRSDSKKDHLRDRIYSIEERSFSSSSPEHLQHPEMEVLNSSDRWYDVTTSFILFYLSNTRKWCWETNSLDPKDNTIPTDLAQI